VRQETEGNSDCSRVVPGSKRRNSETNERTDGHLRRSEQRFRQGYNAFGTFGTVEQRTQGASQRTLGRIIRSGVSLYVHGHPEFFQPFFMRWPRKTLCGSLTASPSIPSTML